MINVKTEVTPGRYYTVIMPAGYDLPIIHPPIVVPAPEPCQYSEIKPRDFKRDVTYWWQTAQVSAEARRMVLNQIKGDLRYRWFRFKLTHGITKDDRSWLFKR